MSRVLLSAWSLVDFASVHFVRSVELLPISCNSSAVENEILMLALVPHEEGIVPLAQAELA